MSRPARAVERDPLDLLERLIRVIFALMVAFLLFAATVSVLHLFGKWDDAHVYSFGRHVCVDSDSYMTGDFSSSQVRDVTTPGSTVQPSGTMFCTRDPSGTMQWAASIEAILSTVLLLGACLLGQRVIRTARRDGLFTARPARSLRTLGWFLIAMSFLGPIAADIGNGIFIAAATTAEAGLTWTSELRSFPVPDFAPLILGMCAFTLGRVMRRGVSLQEEVALTV